MAYGVWEKQKFLSLFVLSAISYTLLSSPQKKRADGIWLMAYGEAKFLSLFVLSAISY
jgi:hypothetical protein